MKVYFSCRNCGALHSAVQIRRVAPLTTSGMFKCERCEKIAHRPYSDPEQAARRLMERARAFEPVQDGRIYIKKINYPIISQDKATPAEPSDRHPDTVARNPTDVSGLSRICEGPKRISPSVLGNGSAGT